ncbi:MAG TPA: 3-dehydroquinate synthase family protein [Candidatus Cloacimonadota bacterium]|nr:3-dehydroquinate synthase family protein [Candidatus Cloacimonadota bacterium]HPT72502.1 3-dehydroquinate synthase family protein [Candidatus Cloacimonadota bacterium]
MTDSKVIQYRFRVQFETGIRLVEKPELLRLIDSMKDEMVIIADQRFYKLYSAFFREIKQEIALLQIKVSPESKDQSIITSIYQFLLEHHVSRNMQVLVMGGGTLMDIAAYAVSTFKRGIQLVLVPTTVIGAVDAAYGGKTAYDMDHIRNLIGTFYPAKQVYLCYDFLKTLDKEDILNGWAEILKIYLIDPSLELPELLHVTYVPPKELIWQAAQAKLEICSSDLFDHGKRRVLNLGHTFGHVLESVSNHSIPHGIAVALGILASAELSMRMERIDKLTKNRIMNLFQEFPFSNYVGMDLPNQLIQEGKEILLQDKKADKATQLVLFSDWREVETIQTREATRIIKCLSDVVNQFIS